MELINFLDCHDGSAMVIVTIMLVLVTCIYTFQTQKQVRVQERPRVLSEIVLGSNKWAIFIKNTNFGKGLATDIELKVISTKTGGLVKTIQNVSLVPEQSSREFIGFFGNEIEIIESRPVVFELSYKDSLGKKYSEEYQPSFNCLDFAVSKGIGHEEQMFRKELLEILKELSTNLKSINKP